MIDDVYPSLAPDDLSAARDTLRPIWQEYVTDVSPWDMAMSLESCAYIWWALQTLKPKKVIDWGSGLTSYVLRTYAAESGAEVWSVDDNGAWLDKTREFLTKHGLSTENVVEWPCDIPDEFDFVVYDLGGGEVRNAHYADALDRLAVGGIALLDDAHFEAHRDAMRAACEKNKYDLFSLHNRTLDSINRFAALAVNPDVRYRYESASNVPSDIYEHLPYLRSLAEDASTVIELGTRGGASTVAFLLGAEQSGGHVWSVDIDPAPAFSHCQWTFLQGDDLDPEIVKQLPDDADVVFIDTSHAYDQTLAELNVYRWKVRPGGKIVLHDTELPHPIGVPHIPRYPVRTAVEEFCNDEGFEWENHTNCFGLGVITIPE